MCNKTVDLGTFPNGAHLFRKLNEAGGYTYFSDEVSGGVMVWDTCLVAESTILTALTCEHHRYYLQKMMEKGKKPTPEMEMEQMAATGGSFISPALMSKLKMLPEEVTGDDS